MKQTKQQDIKIPSVQVQKIPTTITSPVQQTVQAQAIAPSLDIPSSSDISASAISAPISSIAAPEVPALTELHITVPFYEEKYKQMLAAQAEAKTKKKKGFIDSILDEITRYGLFIVFGFVILVVVLALRKDKETPGTGFQMPQHSEKPLGEEQEEPKKDIWHDDF